MLYGQTQWGVEQWGQGPDTAGPLLRNQSPAPGDASVDPGISPYLEVYDAEGNLSALTVKIYINNTLAWSTGRSMPGFSVTTETVSNGIGYTVDVTGQFEIGLQSIRVTAQDTSANALDETYTFSTREPIVTDDEIALIGQQVGFDLALGTARDIHLDGYDLVLVAGADEIAQRLLVGLRLFYGEWFLDPEAGVPYYSDVLVNAPSTRTIETLFRQAILADDDVEAVKNLVLLIDRATRSMSLSFEAVSSVGIVEVEAVLP